MRCFCWKQPTVRLAMRWMRHTALTDKQEDDYHGDPDSKRDENGGVCMMREEREDLASVGGAQEGEEGVTDQAADTQSGQESGSRILHSARGDHKRHKRKWRREQRGDDDRSEAPVFESVDNFCDSFFREAFCERLLTASSRNAIGEEAAEDGTERGHRGVVEPETFVAGGEENRGDIHAAGKRHHGAVEQAEGNQANSA